MEDTFDRVGAAALRHVPLVDVQSAIEKALSNLTGQTMSVTIQKIDFSTMPAEINVLVYDFNFKDLDRSKT